MNGTGASRYRFLSATLVAGALFDAAFGLPVLFLPGLLAPLLGLGLPEPQVYLRLNGVLLLILAMFYLVLARDPGRWVGLVGVAIAGRTMGALFFFLYALGFEGSPVFLLFGLGDLSFAVLHAWGLKRR